MSDALLDLKTLVTRPKISIDGESHEILSPDELPVLTTFRLTSWGKRLDELMSAVQLGAGEEAELAKLVRNLADAIMAPVPASVRKKLSDAQRMSVIEVFSGLLLTKNATTATAFLKGMVRSRAATGEKPPPGSSDSTAAPPAGGSRKRRSRS